MNGYSDDDHGNSIYNARARGYGSWASTPEDQRPAVRFRVKIEGERKYQGREQKVEDHWKLRLQEWLPRTRYGFLSLLVRPAGWYNMDYTNFSPWAGCMGAETRAEALQKAKQLLDAQLAATKDPEDLGTYYYEKGGRFDD